MMYDTVDTFQVACAVPVDEAKIFLDALTTRYPDYADKFSKFVSNPRFKLRCTFRKNLPIGIQAINLYRHSKFSSTVYIVITVQPEALCSGHNTNRVFRCTPQNVYALQLHYANAIYDICPDAFTVKDTDDSCRQETFKLDYQQHDNYPYPVGLAALPYLGLLIAKRVDYSLNIRAENKQLTLECLSKSYLNSKTHDAKQEEITLEADEASAIPDTDALAAYKNYNLYEKTTVASDCIYDKQHKYDLFGCSSQQLYDEAENIIRLESSRRKCSKAWIIKRSNLNLGKNERPMGILPYLEPIVADYVMQNFIAKIGLQDWYSDAEAKKLIDDAVKKGLIKKSIKKTGEERKNSQRLTILQDILPIISQSRSLNSAFKNYQTGCYTLAKTQRIVHGTADIFRDYIKLLRSIGVQPLRIPDKRKVKHLQNPLKNIVLLGLDHTQLPARITAMPAVMAMIRKINAANQRQHRDYKANFNQAT